MEEQFITEKEQLYKIKSRQQFKFKCKKCNKIYHVSKNRFKPCNISRFSTFLCDKCYREYNNSLSLNTNNIPIIKNVNDFYKLIINKPFRYICKKCNKNVIIKSFRRYRINDYSKFLCHSCYCEQVAKENPEILEKRRKTCLNRYGVDTTYKAKTIQEKSKQTKLKKYGNPYYTNREKFYENFKNNHNGISFKDYNKLPKIIEKTKQTNLNKYGTEYGLQCKEIKEKAKQTKLKKYGNEYYTNQKEALQTKLKHFGRTGGFLHKYNYYGVWLDSTPELAIWIYCVDNNISITRGPCILEFIYNNKTHKYIPDFIIDNQLVEIKGDQFIDKDTGKWIFPYDHSLDKLYEAKHRCALQHDVKILYYNDYKKYLDYINNKYGKYYLNQFKINNPYNPSYWCYYINNTNNTNYIPNYYNNSNYNKGKGISPYDINNKDSYTIYGKGISPYDINNKDSYTIYGKGISPYDIK